MATWCKPYAEELPNFEKLSIEYITNKIRFVMVYMDFSKDIKEKVIPFITKDAIYSEIFLLDESD